MPNPSANAVEPPVTERFARLTDPGDFDVRFWQSQPDQVIFEAAHQMVLDYLLLTTGSADEPRLDRTIESFQRL